MAAALENSPNREAPTATATARVTVDGKFFRLAGAKFPIKGVSYGPFGPPAGDGPFADRDQTARDFALMRELGANLLRVYHPPPLWFLDLAHFYNLKVLVDIPWDNYRSFLESSCYRQAALETVRDAVRSCAKHQSVFGYSVANEIPPDVVRWAGAPAVTEFIDALVAAAKSADPDCLCTFTNYPPTEFLRPQSLDFLSFNVYLHNPAPFKNYLARLQMIADSRPLVLAEFGIDSIREGEPRKCEILSWQIETAFRGGLAGAVLFSFTDDWWRGGQKIEDWEMGLTTRDRRPKPSFKAVEKMFHAAPRFPPERSPRVSVVVACYNGERTLNACLESLERLNYPDFEIILVDDGSTDGTHQIATAHPRVRTIQHGKNLGLAVARNTGIAQATGEIIAFTDADCRADEDWLYYLVADLLDGGFAGIGGHNFLPPEDSALAAAVLVSPGGPAHVMLTDREAEHIPGCNMAFFKWALAEINGFDPIFHDAGDDVDLCWRLQERGLKIGFSPGGFVWHYRRSTLRAYLRQQHGYGEAEALLVRKHPEYFNLFGGGVWRGRIYAASRAGILVSRHIIYHGIFGSGWFQTLYSSQPAGLLAFFSSLEYQVLVTLPLFVLSVALSWMLPLAVASLALSLGVCIIASLQAELPPNQRRYWSRPVVALLFFLQPMVRGWARYQGRLMFQAKPAADRESLDSVALRNGPEQLRKVQYFAPAGYERMDFLKAALDGFAKQQWPVKADSGWNEFDLEVQNGRWACLQLVTAAEDYPNRRRMIHCRLRARWSLQARTAFWAALAVEIALVGFIRHWSTWIGLVLLTLPIFIWFLAREKRNLQSLIVVFLDQLAKEQKCQKVPDIGLNGPGREPAGSSGMAS